MTDNEIEVGSLKTYVDTEDKAHFVFEGVVESDIPLLTNSQNFAEAINELKKGLDEGGGGEWCPPSDWPDIPDPAPNQVIIMVEITKSFINIPILSLCFQGETGGEFCDGTEFIDWGDGFIDVMQNNHRDHYSHIYSSTGLYIITVNCSGICNCIDIVNTMYSSSHVNGETYGTTGTAVCGTVRVIEFGSNVFLYRAIPSPAATLWNTDMTSFCGVVYMRFFGECMYKHGGKAQSFYGFSALCKIDFAEEPDTWQANSFGYCYSLKKITLNNIVTIPTGMFTNCFSLKEINLPLAETINANAFLGCTNLEVINAPNLTEISANNFQFCYSLEKINCADECNFNGNEFMYTPLLYPKP